MHVSLASPEAAKAHAAHAPRNMLPQDGLEEPGFSKRQRNPLKSGKNYSSALNGNAS